MYILWFTCNLDWRDVLTQCFWLYYYEYIMLCTVVFAKCPKNVFLIYFYSLNLIWFIRLCNTSNLIEARIKHSSHDSIPLYWHLPLYLTNESSISMVSPQTHWSSISVVCPLPLLHTWPMYLLYPWSAHRPIDLLYQWSVLYPSSIPDQCIYYIHGQPTDPLIFYQWSTPGIL